MSTLDVVAYAGEEFAGSPEAGQLPRHRRRRQRRGDGQRPGDHHRRRAGEERLRQRLRRHHRLRRGGQRHRAGLRAAGQPRRARRRPAGGPAGRQQRRAGPADPDRRRRCPGWSRWTRWTERPAGPPSWLRAEGRTDDGDLSELRLQGHRPGHDRLRGPQAHPADADLRHQDRRRRDPRQGRPDGRVRARLGAGVQLRRRGRRGHRRERHGDLRPGQVHQGCGGRGDRGRDPAGRGDHRGRAGQGHAPSSSPCPRARRPG